jgi:hypothetical protein
MLHPSTPNTQNPLPRTCRIIHTPVPTILTMNILSARLSAKQQTVKAAKGMRSQLRLNLDDVIPPPAPKTLELQAHITKHTDNHEHMCLSYPCAITTPKAPHSDGTLRRSTVPDFAHCYWHFS